MFFGIYAPNFGAQTTPQLLAELAAEAEQAGWDGFFLWDHMVYSLNQKLPLADFRYRYGFNLYSGPSPPHTTGHFSWN